MSSFFWGELHYFLLKEGRLFVCLFVWLVCRCIEIFLPEIFQTLNVSFVTLWILLESPQRGGGGGGLHPDGLDFTMQELLNIEQFLSLKILIKSKLKLV